MNILSIFKQGGNLPVVLARKFEVTDDFNSKDKPLLLIEGDKKGFIPWLLKKLGISDPSTTLRIEHDSIVTTEGGKSFSLLPIRDLHGLKVGYSNDKKYLFLAIITCWTIIGLFLFLWLYSRSGALEVSGNTSNNATFGLRLVSGLSGTKITKDDMFKALENLKKASEQSSRYYNGYYSDKK